MQFVLVSNLAIALPVFCNSHANNSLAPPTIAQHVLCNSCATNSQLLFMSIALPVLRNFHASNSLSPLTIVFLSFALLMLTTHLPLGQLLSLSSVNLILTTHLPFWQLLFLSFAIFMLATCQLFRGRYYGVIIPNRGTTYQNSSMQQFQNVQKTIYAYNNVLLWL